MQERIIVANNLNESELLRTLAKNNINTLGLRIKKPLDIAKDALILSNHFIDKEYLSFKEASVIIYSFINEINYFKNASYEDAKNINRAINNLCHLSINRDIKDVLLMDAEFSDKNEAIYETYTTYKDILAKNNKCDEIDIKLYVLNNNIRLDNEFIILKEFPLSPLDNELIKNISHNNYQEISIKELFKEEKNTNKIEYLEAYGSINEIEYIISYILKNNLPLDKCEIIPVDNKYIQLIDDVCINKNIKVTYNTGLNIFNSNPAKLLRALVYWDNNGYNGIDSLKEILFNKAFDINKLNELFNIELNNYLINDICLIAGNLRISTDKKLNDKRIKEYKKIINDYKILNYVEILAQEFEKGILYFLNEYTIIRNSFDHSALNTINVDINTYLDNIDEANIYDIIEDILNKYVGKEISKEGHLHISNLNNAISSLRDYIFICGLNADSFPGNPKEDYLLLDNDLKAFDKAILNPTSINKIKLIKDNFYNLISLARYLNKKIFLSYSNFNLASIKAQNPSSIIFDLYEEINGNKTIKDLEKELIKVSFFDSNLSKSELIIKEYLNNKDFYIYPFNKELDVDKKVLDKEFSPSALETFFECPRRFYLRRIKGMPELEEDDPFEIASASTIGNLAHKTFELVANKNISEKEFIDIANKLFDEHLISRPPIHKNLALKTKDDFLKMMKKAYLLDPQNKVITAENEYEAKHKSGLKIKGLPDRVEVDKNGNNIIADYKTKRRLEHVSDDIDTCLQVCLYAWLCEANNIPIHYSIYRYLRFNRNITCKYDDEIKEALDQKLNQIVEAIKNNEFPIPKGNSQCKYCTYIDICNAISRKDDNDE